MSETILDSYEVFSTGHYMSCNLPSEYFSGSKDFNLSSQNRSSLHIYFNINNQQD